MLVLSRKSTEPIQMGDRMVISVLEIRGNKVRMGINAPKHIQVLALALVSRWPAGPPLVAEAV